MVRMNTEAEEGHKISKKVRAAPRASISVSDSHEMVLKTVKKNKTGLPVQPDWKNTVLNEVT